MPHYENVPFEVPKGWVWTTIEEICSKIGSGSTPKGSNYSVKGIPFSDRKMYIMTGLFMMTSNIFPKKFIRR